MFVCISLIYKSLLTNPALCAPSAFSASNPPLAWSVRASPHPFPARPGASHKDRLAIPLMTRLEPNICDTFACQAGQSASKRTMQHNITYGCVNMICVEILKPCPLGVSVSKPSTNTQKQLPREPVHKADTSVGHLIEVQLES